MGPKPSAYNVTARVSPEKYIVFNTLTKAAIEVPHDSYVDLFSSSEHESVLYDLGFLTYPDEESASLARHFAEEASSQNLSLTWHVTRKCNFACSYCFQSEHYSDKHVSTGKLSGWVLRRLESMKSKTLSLTLFGGEPLLEIERIVHFIDDLNSYEISLQACIVTNGWFLTPPIVRMLVDLGISRFEVTLDGYGKCHDRRRPTVEGAGTYERVFENVISALDKMSGTLRINWDERNINSISRLIKEIASQTSNTDRLTLDFHYVFYNRFITDTTHVDRIYHKIMEPLRLAKEYGLRIQNPLSCRLCYGRRPSALVVDELGRLFKCNLMVEAPEMSLGTIDEFQVSSAVSNLPLLVSSCSSCPYFPLCGGGCLFAARQGFGSGCRKSEFENAKCFILPFCY